MNYYATLLPVGLFLASASQQCRIAAADQAELLVKWKDGPESRAASQGNSQIGSVAQRNFNSVGWQLIKLPSGMSAQVGLAAYRRLDSVLAAEQDQAVPVVPSVSFPRAAETEKLHRSSSAVPNDPLFASQWYLRKIDAPGAWKISTGSTNAVIAIIDTGVDYNHPDLARNMWRNPGESGLDAGGKNKATNGIDDDENGYVDDLHGIDTIDGTGDPMDKGYSPGSTPLYHGTFIAGIIGAQANNSEGITGLNWAAQIMAIRMYGGDQSNPQFIQRWWSRNLEAFEYVIRMKRRGVNIRITNNSYGGSFVSEAMRDAFAAAAEEGILNVCGANNDGQDRDLLFGFPASVDLPCVLSVAASTENDALASFSNFGRSTVHLAAPGASFTSTSVIPEYLTGRNGTSYACPLVAGTAALLLAVEPNRSLHQLRAALFGSVDPLPALRGKVVTNGRLNAARALEYLANTNPPAIVVAAHPAGPRALSNAPIQVTFNRPMDRNTVESAFVINPPVSGTFEWADSNDSFFFRHSSSFDSAANYTVRLLGTAKDELGQTLDGNFNRVHEGSPADDFQWNFRFAIPNDNFLNASLIAGAAGTLTANNRNAILEPGEPLNLFGDWRNYGSSVWYKFISAENDIWITFDLTKGTTFDSLIAVYSGNNLEALQPIALNDNYGSSQGSRVTFRATAGAQYSVTVAGKSQSDPSRSGPFTLSWHPTPSAGFTGTQFFPSSGEPGTKVTLTGTNFTGATSVLFNGVSGSFTNALTNNLDLRITAIVPPDATSGPITVITPHGNATSTATFQVIRPALTLTRTAANELTLNWQGTTFSLESSTDLRIWTEIAPAGATTATVNPNQSRLFFRLRQP